MGCCGCRVIRRCRLTTSARVSALERKAQPRPKGLQDERAVLIRANLRHGVKALLILPTDKELNDGASAVGGQAQNSLKLV